MYVDQSRDALDPEKTVYEEICSGAEEIDLNGRKVSARAYCSWYNFKGNDQQKKASLNVACYIVSFIPLLKLGT